jgi:hypothetical protein
LFGVLGEDISLGDHPSGRCWGVRKSAFQARPR